MLAKKCDASTNGNGTTFEQRQAVQADGLWWEYTTTVAANATILNCCFNNGSGTWDNNGFVPGEMSAWSKVFLGWIQPVVLSSDSIASLSAIAVIVAGPKTDSSSRARRSPRIPGSENTCARRC